MWWKLLLETFKRLHSSKLANVDRATPRDIIIKVLKGKDKILEDIKKEQVISAV
jgi:hypothetical protein